MIHFRINSKQNNVYTGEWSQLFCSMQWSVEHKQKQYNWSKVLFIATKPCICKPTSFHFSVGIVELQVLQKHNPYLVIFTTICKVSQHYCLHTYNGGLRLSYSLPKSPWVMRHQCWELESGDSDSSCKNACFSVTPEWHSWKTVKKTWVSPPNSILIPTHADWSPPVSGGACSLENLMGP